ncbi:MAG: hypothetical protein ACU85V_09860, partial [Gammaproteobacteria bacterium]
MSAAGRAPRRPSRERLVGCLILAMITWSVLSGVSRGALPAWPAGLLAWVVGALLLRSISRFQRLQVAFLAGVGLLALVAASLAGDTAWPEPLVVGNQAMLAMLATVSLLRMVTRTGAAPGEALPRGRAAVYQTLAATHLFSAVVNISATYIVGQRIARDDSLTPLQAKVVTRAFVAAACWSPLFASMAVAMTYVPGADMLKVARVNIVLAFVLLAYSAFGLGRDPGAAVFTGFPVHREALTVPCVLGALVLVLYGLPTGWPIL